MRRHSAPVSANNDLRRISILAAIWLAALANAGPGDIGRHIAVLQKGEWSSWQVPDAARRSLAKEGAAAVAPLCAAMASNPDRRFHAWAEAALHDIVRHGAHKASVRAALCRALVQAKYPAAVRNTAARLLGRLGDAGASPALAAALADPAVRVQAALALGDIGARDAAPALRRLLHSKLATDALAAAVEALGELGDADSVPLIVPLTRSKDPRLRRAAIDALGAIHSDAAAWALKALIESDDERTAKRAAVAMLRRGKALVAAGDIKALLAAGDRACQGCHAQTFADFEKDLHRTKKKMACSDCHGESVKHMEDYGKTKPSKPTSKPLMVTLCGECHFDFESYKECAYDPIYGLDHRFKWSSYRTVCRLIAQVKDEEPPEGMRRLVEDDFESMSSLARWFTYPRGVWRIADDDDAETLQLVRPAGFAGAVLRDYEVTDFVLTVVGRCSIKRGDVDLLFGWQDPNRLYFMHCSPFTRPGYNMIAVQTRAGRRIIHREKRPPARLTGTEYHVMRVERRVDDGVIYGYIDDLETPIFTAKDRTYTSGLVGVGSLGDAGFFDYVRLDGKLARKRTVDLSKVKVPDAPTRGGKPQRKLPPPRPLKKVATDPRPPRDLPLLFEDDFSEGRIDLWRPRKGNLWRLGQVNGDNAYQTVRVGPPGRVRAPRSMSILKDLAVTDFCITAQVRCMSPPGYDGRDMCIFFGYQDPTHFYYVHFAGRTDSVHNAILKVDGKDRTPITSTRKHPARLIDQGWYRLKVERNVSTGEIKAYVDDMEKPIMTATDKTFTWGLIGVGAFDDLGFVDDVRVWGKRYEGVEAPDLP